MKMPDLGWAKHTPEEVDYLQQYIPNKESFILDIGCGIGRHTAELSARGYKNIKAYDFSSTIIVDYSGCLRRRTCSDSIRCNIL